MHRPSYINGILIQSRVRLPPELTSSVVAALVSVPFPNIASYEAIWGGRAPIANGEITAPDAPYLGRLKMTEFPEKKTVTGDDRGHPPPRSRVVQTGSAYLGHGKGSEGCWRPGGANDPIVIS